LKPEELTSEQKHAIIVAAAEDKKANYVTSLDLRGRTVIADYFVICTGTSNIHIRAIADGIMEEMEKKGHRRELLEGYSEATWILLSYGDVITHIFAETQREYYNLEKLWSASAAASSDDVADEVPEAPVDGDNI
jgi:ribosome-associated protein